MKLIVRANGTVAGSGVATATDPPTCTGGFAGPPAATKANLLVAGGFTGSKFNLRFSATTLEPNGFEGGFHVLYYPGPPTIVVPMVKKDKASAVFVLDNEGPEELRGGGGFASMAGGITLRKG
jgi:hypothetical protein